MTPQPPPAVELNLASSRRLAAVLTSALLVALLLALAIGVLALQSPRPRDLQTAATDFSAARAMIDLREIARRPHPVGTPDNARVRAYLAGRLSAMGLTTSLQSGVLSPDAVKRMTRWGLDPAAPVVNIVAVLPATAPGADPDAPAVLLMAHYDSTHGSPGAADDATGVAAILEGVRAIQARGPTQRPLIVLLTDGEELNLDGARNFFGDHPLRERIGAVVNLEARGGGGRAMMFETGPGNRETIDLFARAVRRAPGGATSNSLAVLVYEAMPNGTDFTIARQRGLAGVNLAFIGRPAQYHSGASTPDNLDQGSLQHIGGQALETADLLVRAPVLPQAGDRRVYADLLGLVVVGHAPAFGWVLLAVGLALTGFAAWGARHATGLRPWAVARGAADGLWALTGALVLTQAVRTLAGPLSSRAESAETYYVLLARLPWIEIGAALTVTAVALIVLAGRQAAGRRILSAVVAGGAVLATVLAGASPLILGAAVIALGLGWTTTSTASDSQSDAPTDGRWAGTLGLIALVWLLALPVQLLAPEAAFLLIWPALLASAAAAVAALIGARLERPAAFIPFAVAAALGGGWIVYLAHPVFLGVGMDLPGVLAPLMLLAAMLFRPLAPPAPRLLTVAAAVVLVVGCGVSLAARLI